MGYYKYILAHNHVFDAKASWTGWDTLLLRKTYPNPWYQVSKYSYQGYYDGISVIVQSEDTRSDIGNRRYDAREVPALVYPC